ncbi:AfsR/SARP family transcriptional regulator [Pseudonocardia kunmingensis]|uniref:DNA-binding SARP family transcriptional activator n=1 Tax=Pseudonocardia kunmingensis TaxID=630975 RepID=A0A543D0P9_9PSEU|nr:BTAD domain-containing putative transcriptional regulator [Pseudonocardia kunmingensis]TQM02902.1 DNA-binding SARP family transcriptional activator [Pseudonocardia kunmingensis]
MTAPVVRVLGPVEVRDPRGHRLDVKGPRHREVLARLVVARGRVVPVPVLVEDLWGAHPPRRAVGAVRTFVSDLRAALDPHLRSGGGARSIVTEGTGYAFRAATESVDAWRFAAAVGTADARRGRSAEDLRCALELWRGTPYADFPDAHWARGDRARLTELRLATVEQLAAALLAAGRPADAAADLDAHVTEHPWREEGWRLLALALYRCDRQGDALAVLRRAATLLAEELGIDPGPALGQLRTDILRRAPHLDPPGATPGDPPGATLPAQRIRAGAAAEWERSTTVSERATLVSTTALLRSLAVHGGQPGSAIAQHAATVAAAEDLGDPELTARILAAYDVPSVWSRADDPDASAAVAAAAERTLRLLPEGGRPPLRARLLTRIAVETRGLPGARGREAAAEAEALARGSADPALLVTALSGTFLQTFSRAGLAAERDAIGREIVGIADEHDLPTSAVLGRIIRMQALSGLGDLDGAAGHAEALAELGERLDRPLAGIFVAWFRAMRAVEDGAADAEDRYRRAADALAGAGMPGVETGLLAFALTCLRLRRGAPLAPLGDLGPYEPWVRPHLLLARRRHQEAEAAVGALPDPPPGHLQEALWWLAGRAALATGDARVAARAEAALAPAATELAGASSAMVSLGPVADLLRALRG